MPAAQRPDTWQALKEERKTWKTLHLRNLFARDKKRAERFSLQWTICCWITPRT
jgi:hypothetical protein